MKIVVLFSLRYKQKKRKKTLLNLTLSKTSPGFYVSAVEVF